MATAPPQKCPGHSGGRCWGPRGPSPRPQWPRIQYTELFRMPQQSTMLRIISKIYRVGAGGLSVPRGPWGGRGQVIRSKTPWGGGGDPRGVSSVSSRRPPVWGTPSRASPTHSP